ncbi:MULTISPECIES: hypothetical protein [unclassified Xanthomonas]|uniref:hypothetical protein n=1 Tax=Xanthomonas sp. LMG 9002 TaxID=1591158 RepID=UPI00136AC4A2|nr:hypothetical protein [Xanthomonas sp. LMG 9002]MXV07133.1 hypothetical protein [Xanthomonas sp. LMG 9002]
MHCADDVVEIERLVKMLVAEGYFAYCKWDGAVPILFALGQKKTHSVDVRRRGGQIAVEYWFGYPDDELMREELFQSFAKTVAPVQAWLAKDAAN